MWEYEGESEFSGLEISDLMMGLVAVFLVGSVLMLDVVGRYNHEASMDRQHLDAIMKDELGAVAQRNGIELLDGGILRLRGGFKHNESTLTDQMKSQLDDFCPRLKSLVISSNDLIERVVFEGHTDASWKDGDANTPYFGNQLVSNERAANAMKYCLGRTFETEYETLMPKFLAIGYSYSKPVREKSGRVNTTKSKRVDIVIHEIGKEID